MKRWVIALLALLLVLYGCSSGNEPTTEPSEPTASGQPTEPSGPTDPPKPPVGESILDGAITVYTVSGDAYEKLLGLGDKLLLKGKQSLTLLSAENSAEIATHRPEKENFTACHTEPAGVSYFLPDTKTAVILNPQLKEVSRIQMPENMVGEPVASIAREEIYYSTGSEIRAIHINTGVSRLLRTYSAGTVSVMDLYFSGTVLWCETEASHSFFISVASGQTLGESSDVMDLHTYGEKYVLQRSDGGALQMIFGTRGQTPQTFVTDWPAATMPHTWTPILAQNGILQYITTNITSYHTFTPLTPGEKSTSICCWLGSCYSIYGTEDYIWVLTAGRKSDAQILYKWDVSKSPAEGGPAQFTPVYSKDNPDTEGLKELRALADTYQSKYGVKIHLWDEVMEHTGAFAVEQEHNPYIIRKLLEELVPVLERFPEKFLQKTVEAGWIRIGLVRSIEGGRQWTQFWKEGDCWILLTDRGVVSDHLIRGIACGIDSHVLGNSRDYDTWNALNPEGFAYAYSEQLGEINRDYLEGENPYFADEKSMTYPHEDRCSIFFYAMHAGYPDTFKTPAMQAKLLRLCKAIREAYDLEKNTESFAWERYLKEPIGKK